MSLDLAVLVFLSIAFLVGILRGVLRQSVSLTGFIAGILAAWLLSSPLAGLIVRDNEIYRALIAVASGLVFFLVAYYAVRRLMNRVVEEKEITFQGGVKDRLLGGLLMLAKWAVIILLLAWLFEFIAGDKLRTRPGLERILNESRLARLCRTQNPVARITTVRRYKGLLVATEEPGSRLLLESQPAYVRMISNPHYKAVKDDGVLSRALEKRDWEAVVKNRNLKALAGDWTFWGDFAAVRWEETLAYETPPSARRPERGAAGAPEPRPTPAAVKTAPPPTATPVTPPAARETATPAPGLSKLYLTNGSVIEGKVLSENARGMEIEVYIQGGTIKMSLTRREIRHIERPR